MWGDDDNASVTECSDSSDDSAAGDPVPQSVTMTVRHAGEKATRTVVFTRAPNLFHPSLVWREEVDGCLRHMYSRNETVESLADWMRCDFQGVDIQTVKYDDDVAPKI